MNVFIVAAHPDDEVLGVGGTALRHIEDGDDVHVLIMSEGATSRYGSSMVSELTQAAEGAARVLGVTSLETAAWPDQRMDTVPLIELTQFVEQRFATVPPHVIYTHFPHDVNADHGLVAQATWTAARPYSLSQLESFYTFETPSSTEWAWPLPETGFRPNHFVDITGQLDRKLAAMAFYTSELRPEPHPRALESLRRNAQKWGSTAGRPAAEAFMLMRSVR